VSEQCVKPPGPSSQAAEPQTPGRASLARNTSQRFGRMFKGVTGHLATSVLRRCRGRVADERPKPAWQAGRMGGCAMCTSGATVSVARTPCGWDAGRRRACCCGPRGVMSGGVNTLCYCRADNAVPLGISSGVPPMVGTVCPHQVSLRGPVLRHFGWRLPECPPFSVAGCVISSGRAQAHPA
jgi:hypothetical protein